VVEIQQKNKVRRPKVKVSSLKQFDVEINRAVSAKDTDTKLEYGTMKFGYSHSEKKWINEHKAD